MAKTSVELREQRAALVKQARELQSKADEEKRELNGEEREKWANIMGDIHPDSGEPVEGEIDRLEKRAVELEKLESAEESLERQPERRTAPTQPTAEPSRPNGKPKSFAEQRSLAINGWLLNANRLPLEDRHHEAAKAVGFNLNANAIDIDLNKNYREVRAEVRGLSVGTDADGGYTVQTDLASEIDRQMLAYGNVRNVARVFRTPKGNPIKWPTVNDTAQTAQLEGEGDTLAAATDPTFAQVSFDAYKLSSDIIQVSHELLEDSEFNIGQLVGEILGERLARKENGLFTSGTGSSQHQGIVTGSALGVTAAAVAAITADELIDLYHSVDIAYRTNPGSGWMMHDGIAKIVRKLKDQNDQYLWQPGMQAGTPDQLFGRRVSINNDMPGGAVPAATEKSVLYGDFQKFVIRDTGTVRLRRLDELYAASDEIGFVALTRSDSALLQSVAVKHLIQAAS